LRLITTIILTALFFIWPVFPPSGVFGESPPEAAEQAAPQMPFIKEAGERYAGRFPLKKVGSEYVSVHYTDKNGKPKEEPLDAITIPGTEITAGVFPYEFIDERGEENSFPPKTGALINDSIYYVESCDKYGCGHLDMSEDTSVLIYKNYFTIDACTYGASACGRKMALFRYTKNSIEVLDYMESSSLEFNPESNFNDIDNDGNPEVRVSIRYGTIKNPVAFELFFEIKDDKLQVDFNPELYKPLFKEIERESRNKTEKPEAYYVYGFLSGKLSLKKITAMLAGKEDTGEKEHYIVRILNRRDTWNAGFHDYNNKPVLIRHNLKQKTGGK